MSPAWEVAAKEVYFLHEAESPDPAPRCGKLDIDICLDAKHRLLLEKGRCRLVDGHEVLRRLIGQQSPCNGPLRVAHDQAGAADDFARDRAGKARPCILIGARIGHGIAEIVPRPRLTAIGGKLIDVMGLERYDDQRSWPIICGVRASMVNGSGSSPSR